MDLDEESWGNSPDAPQAEQDYFGDDGTCKGKHRKPAVTHHDPAQATTRDKATTQPPTKWKIRDFEVYFDLLFHAIHLYNLFVLLSGALGHLVNITEHTSSLNSESQAIKTSFLSTNKTFGVCEWVLWTLQKIILNKKIVLNVSIQLFLWVYGISAGVLSAYSKETCHGHRFLSLQVSYFNSSYQFCQI